MLFGGAIKAFFIIKNDFLAFRTPCMTYDKQIMLTRYSVLIDKYFKFYKVYCLPKSPIQ